MLFNMKKYHHYEYNKNKKAIVLFTFSCLVGFIIESIVVYFGAVCPRSKEDPRYIDGFSVCEVIRPG